MASRIAPVQLIRLVLEIAAGLAAYFGGFEFLNYVFHGHTETVAEWYMVATLVVGVAVGLGRVYLTIRKERYANVAPCLHNIQHMIRDIHTYIKMRRPPPGSTEIQLSEFSSAVRDRLEHVLTQLQLLFTSLTSTHCRTSIKLVYYGQDNDAYYFTLARDRGSSVQLFELDNKRVSTNHDPLRKNKQFSRIFDDKDDRWHYICSDLTADPEFTSTSFTAYDPEWAERPPIANDRWRIPLIKRNKWVLPYRSTIACIIRQSTMRELPDVPALGLGFLTVDSESRGVFLDRWDTQIMYSVADALFHPLRDYLAVTNQPQRGSTALVPTEQSA